LPAAITRTLPLVDIAAASARRYMFVTAAMRERAFIFCRLSCLSAIALRRDAPRCLIRCHTRYARDFHVFADYAAISPVARCCLYY